ncbi:hypothetical protein ACW9HQ_45195, partial [Nocardia gipuzkoensis]
MISVLEFTELSFVFFEVGVATTMHHADHDHVEPEIRVERDYLATCRVELARMREEAVTALATGVGEADLFDKFHNFAARQFHKKQIESMSDLEDVPLFFGRLDYPLGEVYDEIREL